MPRSSKAWTEAGAAARKYAESLTPDQEARIEAGIAADRDNPELTEAEMASLRPAQEALPAKLYASLTRPRGRPKSEAPKVAVKLRVEPDLLRRYKDTGPGYQTRMQEALRRGAPRLAAKKTRETVSRTQDRPTTRRPPPKGKR